MTNSNKSNAKQVLFSIRTKIAFVLKKKEEKE
jgi:hypothetical protein